MPSIFEMGLIGGFASGVTQQLNKLYDEKQSEKERMRQIELEREQFEWEEPRIKARETWRIQQQEAAAKRERAEAYKFAQENPQIGLLPQAQQEALKAQWEAEEAKSQAEATAATISSAEMAQPGYKTPEALQRSLAEAKIKVYEAKATSVSEMTHADITKRADLFIKQGNAYLKTGDTVGAKEAYDEANRLLGITPAPPRGGGGGGKKRKGFGVELTITPEEATQLEEQYQNWLQGTEEEKQADLINLEGIYKKDPTKPEAKLFLYITQKEGKVKPFKQQKSSYLTPEMEAWDTEKLKSYLREYREKDKEGQQAMADQAKEVIESGQATPEIIRFYDITQTISRPGSKRY